MAEDEKQAEVETAAEGAQGQAEADSAERAGKAATEAEEVKDRHGQPGINRDKYQRDMKAKDDEIAALKAQVEESAKSEEGRKELSEKIVALEQEIRDERLAFDLERAGCRNNKAAKALLDDYDGDIKKLKEAEPWLFDDGKPKGATGLKPDGAPGGNEQEERLRKVAGLPPKKE